VIDTCELASSLMDTPILTMGQRTNEVMASIVIPLTFLAGIYGMNFDYLPELHYRWARYALLGVMTVVAIGMLTYFRRRGWLGGTDGPDEE